MPGKKQKLLLIEPDDAVRSAISMLLESAGWRVCAFADAAHLAEDLDGFNPAVLVAEAELPDLRATGVLDLARSHGVPVIFLGHGQQVQKAVDLMRMGARDFLEKPFPQGRLLDLLDSLRS